MGQLDATGKANTHRASATIIARAARFQASNSYGAFDVSAYKMSEAGACGEYLVLCHGNVQGQRPLVRLHSACIAGDVFGLDRCDCRWQLDAAMDRVVAEGFGIIIYGAAEEGRGSGVVVKTESCILMDVQGCTTARAFEQLGVPVDRRSYVSAAVILADLGVDRCRLMTNNPAKVDALRTCGIDVEVIPLIMESAGPRIRAYLNSKRAEMGHVIPEPEAP